MMKTKKQPIQAFFLGIMISIGITLTGATIAAVSLSGSASTSYSEATLNISGTNSATSASANMNLANQEMAEHYQKTRYHQLGTMTREKYDDGCYYNFNSIGISAQGEKNQAKTGGLRWVTADISETRYKIDEIADNHRAVISRENFTKDRYEVILRTEVGEFDDVMTKLSKLDHENDTLVMIACSENVTIPMINTENDLQKMKVWTERYKRVFDLKIEEFERAHDSELVNNLRELESAELTFQNYQKQVDALQEKSDFLANITEYSTISISISKEENAHKDHFGQWLVTLFTGQS